MERGSLIGWMPDDTATLGAVPFSLLPESTSQKDMHRKVHFSGAPRHMQ
jgi:hypothetical protein